MFVRRLYKQIKFKKTRHAFSSSSTILINILHFFVLFWCSSSLCCYNLEIKPSFLNHSFIYIIFHFVVVNVCIDFVLKTLDTIGNCQRLVFAVGVSRHMHKITNLWKFELNRSLKLRDINELRKNILVAPLSHVVVCFQMLDFETSNS